MRNENDFPKDVLREAYIECVVEALRDYWKCPGDTQSMHVKFALEDFRKVAWRENHKEA